jgi:heme a synthase
MNTPVFAPPSSFRPGLVYGFAAVVLMWCAWFATHIPGVGVSVPAAAALILAGLLLAAALGGWSMARGGAAANAWKVGLIAGVVSSLVNLVVMGSYLVEQAAPGQAPAEGASGLKPGAILYIPGFLALGAIVGAIGAVAGSLFGRSPAPADGRWAGATHWLGRMAWVTAAAALPLLFLGGLVTSTQSGMAVPDWPGSYGANMFLYPISLMSHPRIFLEHSHRLFGAMVGLTTLTLFVTAIASPVSRAFKAWAGVLLAMVIIQGVLGGKRVSLDSPALAVVHGVLAQIFFATLVGYATALSRPVRELVGDGAGSSDAAGATDEARKTSRKRKFFATGLVHALILQLIFGAWYRHLGQMHPLYTHAAWAMVVMVFAIIAGLMLRNGERLTARPATRMRAIGAGMLASVSIQFALGWVAFALVLHGPAKGNVPDHTQMDAAPTVPLTQTLVTTAHQGNGALLIGLAAAGMVLSRAAYRRSA